MRHHQATVLQEAFISSSMFAVAGDKLVSLEPIGGYTLGTAGDRSLSTAVTLSNVNAHAGSHQWFTFDDCM